MMMIIIILGSSMHLVLYSVWFYHATVKVIVTDVPFLCSNTARKYVLLQLNAHLQKTRILADFLYEASHKTLFSRHLQILSFRACVSQLRLTAHVHIICLPQRVNQPTTDSFSYSLIMPLSIVPLDKCY